MGRRETVLARWDLLLHKKKTGVVVFQVAVYRVAMLKI